MLRHHSTPLPQAYLPFMLSVKGQLRTIELSLLRYDGQNLFLSKPESAPPLEQKWRVAPLRWSAEREPFCILTHRETSRLRLVVAKPDCACELWPVMYSSDKPDGGIVGCSISPSRCKLVSFMWKGGLYVIAVDKQVGGAAAAILQINAPQEPWVCVRDPIVGEWEPTGSTKLRVTPFYHKNVMDPAGPAATYVLVQDDSGVEVRQIVNPAQPWVSVTGSLAARGAPLRTSKVQFVYCRSPPATVGSDAQWPVEVFAVWVDGCSLYLAHIPDVSQTWNLLCTVPIPPHSKLGTMYVPFLPEPLLVSTSTDPHYVGSVALRRLFLAERLIAMHTPSQSKESILPPRVIRYMQVPALPVAPRDLTADFPVSDLAYREFHGEFVGKRLPYDLTPANVPISAQLPPPPAAPNHGPIPLMLYGGSGQGSVLSSLQGKRQLDWTPGPCLDDPSKVWKVTPLRWAPGREVLFVVMQSVELKSTRVAIASSDKPCAEWTVQCEFPDAAIPFSECLLVPFQYQTMPGSSDLFVLAIHQATQKGGLFFISNPKSEWQFIREVDEPDFLVHTSKVSVMYHRSKDPASVNLCTFFLISSPGEQLKIRVLIEPNQPTFDVTRRKKKSSSEISLAPPQGAAVTLLYAFSPKPPVTHVWPVEVFAAWVDGPKMVVAHIPGPDLDWREMYSHPVPAGVRIAPVYLPYLAEPILLAVIDGRTVDLLRLNLIQAYLENDQAVLPRFIHRYAIQKQQVGGSSMEIADTTLDTALVWLPQMGLQGMHPYSGYPLPFEGKK